jgi:hypothetical protein
MPPGQPDSRDPARYASLRTEPVRFFGTTYNFINSSGSDWCSGLWQLYLGDPGSRVTVCEIWCGWSHMLYLLFRCSMRSSRIASRQVAAVVPSADKALQSSLRRASDEMHLVRFFCQYFNFSCQYHSTNAPYSFTASVQTAALLPFYRWVSLLDCTRA